MVGVLRCVLRVIVPVAVLLSLTGNVFAGASCSLNPANRTITLCTPANNATVGTTFHINAGVTDSIAIQYMQVYVNHVLYVTQKQNFVDANITVPGPIANAPVTVQAREANSTFFIKAHYTLQIVNNNPPPTLTVTPATATVQEGAPQQFSANRPASWSATCGTIDSAGLFTAPLAAGSCTINAVATDGSGTKGSATATVSSPITITPQNPTTPAGGQQQFTANVAVNWAASCGIIDATGLFTAPNTPGAHCTITATAASGTAFTAQTVDTVGAPPPIHITPLSPTVSEGATQQFAADIAVTWAASCGTIDTTGLFTAPLAPTGCTITATASDGSGRTASTTATVTSPITITPPSANTAAGGTQQFTANVAVNWTASCGSIDTTGLFTAPFTTGMCTITATASSGPAYTAQAVDTVGPPPALSVTPANPTLSENGTQQFTVTPTVPVNWTASCGTIDTTGLYTAPLVTGACTVTATATDGSNRTASTTATITSPITITPSSATTKVNATQQFTANVAVNWSTSCGTINSAGLFTAPAATGSCTITATAASAPAFTATAVDTVIAGGGGQNYTTWKNNSMRTGLNSTETTLTPANVNTAHFGRIFKSTVDGGVWAQPLYMSGLTVNGATRNVVFVETSNDSAYAFDADTGAQLWKVSFLSPGVTPATHAQTNSTMGQIGVTGTPVIDPASGTIYMVAETAESGGTAFFHRLHALDVTNGHEKFGGPIVIATSGFASKEQLQRPGLLLSNGNVYVTFGSQGDTDPYHGWIFAYNSSTLGLSAAWNDTTNGKRGGIWMGGSGLAADSAGDIFVSIGNGDWNGTTQFGQSVVKLTPALTVADYFTSFNQVNETRADQDLGSGGVLLVPDQPGPHPHELIACGKLPSIYLIDRDMMGHIGTTSDNVIQKVAKQLGGTSGKQVNDSCFTTAAYFNQNIYFIGNNDSMKMFSLSPATGLLSTAPVSKDTFTYAFPGGQAVISSNGTSNGIVWGFDYTTGTLHAYDATNVSHVLYVSPATGAGIKYSVPTVVNGHVYVGINKAIVGFASH